MQVKSKRGETVLLRTTGSTTGSTTQCVAHQDGRLAGYIRNNTENLQSGMDRADKNRRVKEGRITHVPNTSQGKAINEMTVDLTPAWRTLENKYAVSRS